MVDVLIQTHNEELNLGHALKSVQGWVNRVFIVDSGSADGTAAIAAEYGATFVFHAWEGYAAQKNWALDHLPFESPWILVLDADELITPELRDEITAIVSRPAESIKTAGFYLNRTFIFLGQPIYHCGYFPSWNLRLFKRGMARYEDREVHEHMIVSGPTQYLKKLMIHEDRRGLEHFVAKHNRYSTLEAQSIYRSQARWPGLGRIFTDRMARTRFLKDKVVPRLPAPWLFRFFYMYIVRMGILDRRGGWMLSNFIASYDLFVYAKYRELKRMHGRRPTPSGGLALPEGNLPLQLPAPVDPVRTTQRPVATPMPVTPPAPAAVTPRFPVATPVIERTRQTEKARVSVMIPTLNEEANLPRCLDHLQWADEVVVVDSGSRDRTQQIAEEYGARVVTFKWDGQWPKKKNWALRNVDFRNEWVLIVDADEWITADLASEIVNAIKSDQFMGYYVNRRFIFMGRWIRHCGYYPSWNLRLFKRGHGEYEQLVGVGDTGSGDNEVHEHVICDEPVGHLHSDMLHFAFPTVHIFMEKHNRYSNWEAAVQQRKISNPSAVLTSTDLSRRRWLKNLSRHVPFRPTLRFLYSYFWKLGFLDGSAGYIFCRLLAIYEFLSVAKYRELTLRETDSADASSAVPSFARAALNPAGAAETKASE
jgi:glycosyltransferase involved in cell wall biosynthesis